MISTETFNKLVDLTINGSPGFDLRALFFRWAKLEPEKAFSPRTDKEWQDVQAAIWQEIKKRQWNASVNTFNNWFKVQLFAKDYPCFGIGESYRENLGEAMLAAYLDAIETESIPTELIRERMVQEV